jgi:hypothetical protein
MASRYVFNVLYCGFFILTHEAAVALDIGTEDSGEFAFRAFFCHGCTSFTVLPSNKQRKRIDEKCGRKERGFGEYVFIKRYAVAQGEQVVSYSELLSLSFVWCGYYQELQYKSLHRGLISLGGFGIGTF